MLIRVAALTEGWSDGSLPCNSGLSNMACSWHPHCLSLSSLLSCSILLFSSVMEYLPYVRCYSRVTSSGLSSLETYHPVRKVDKKHLRKMKILTMHQGATWEGDQCDLVCVLGAWQGCWAGSEVETWWWGGTCACFCLLPRCLHHSPQIHHSLLAHRAFHLPRMVYYIPFLSLRDKPSMARPTFSNVPLLSFILLSIIYIV